MVLEIKARDVLARTGSWKGPSGPEVRLPILLRTLPSISRGELDEGDEAILTATGPGPDGVLVVRDLGSTLRPVKGDGGDWAHLVIPAEEPLPPSLADELDSIAPTTVSEDGLVEVVHAAASRVADDPPPPGSVQWVVMASAASLVGRPPWFIDAVMRAKERAGPGRLLYLPGVATPRNLALLSYLGVDVVDDVQCHLEAARGRRIRPELGHVHRPDAGTDGDLVARNLSTMRDELALVREVVEHEALRELVEVRVRSEPWQVAALRRVDRQHRSRLLPYCPVHRDAPLLALSRESLERIEVTSWVEALLERYEPPANTRVLLLLPCSARKPYGNSRTHRRIAEALSSVPNRATVHEVILTSPLGAVPRELERTYPAAHYDIPVSGDWFPDEVERMRSLVEHIRTVGTYDAVISHMGPGLPFLEEDGSVSRSRTGGEGALDNGALGQLASLVSQAASDALRTSRWERQREDLASLARFQFGRDVAKALLEGGQVAGRPPGLRLKGPDGDQRAMVVPARGRLSLTLSGAELVAAAGHHRVWMDDFELRGDLFAVGVTDADPLIRPEDEAVVVRGDLVVGVGVARMGTTEMLAANRGTAVAMRHHRGRGRGGGGGGGGGGGKA